MGTKKNNTYELMDGVPILIWFLVLGPKIQPKAKADTIQWQNSINQFHQTD